MSASPGKTICVVGSGLIGRSWAMVFLSGGYKVKLYDNQAGQAARAVQDVRGKLEELQQNQMLRGDLNVEEQLALLSSHDDLSEALEGSFFVQECVFEELQAKQSVFQAVERCIGQDVILSSSTSCLLPSKAFSGVQNKKRCIVSHPVSSTSPAPGPSCLPSLFSYSYLFDYFILIFHTLTFIVVILS
ncbi:lambda-crystallin homolog [Arapaima gigas]